MSVRHLVPRLARVSALMEHPQAETLLDVVTGETNVSTAGFPYISDAGFRAFVDGVPHLFREGEAILSWLRTLNAVLDTWGELGVDERTSLERAMRVMRTMVYTAAITAPSDLWLLRQVLSVHKRLGLLDQLLEGRVMVPEALAVTHNLNARLLRIDLHFLYTRGYLRKQGVGFIVSDSAPAAEVLAQVEALDPAYQIHMVPRVKAWLVSQERASTETAFVTDWLAFKASRPTTPAWVATLFQIEVGYRLLVLVLGLRVLELTQHLTEGTLMADVVPGLPPAFYCLFDQAGWASDGCVTQLGARGFARGPGPFGIIGAYYPYLNRLDDMLQDRTTQVWVVRGENVAASQDANRKTFIAANDALDAFVEQYGFEYTVFIEHAVGQGEASRQRYERSGDTGLHYFGADLEDAAIDQALIQQKKGVLPPGMAFIRSADIGEPARVIDYIRGCGLSTENAVMMVGNGFHEIREQTNEKMIGVFKAYHDAGIVSIFTEASALSDEDILHTAWNTYHAGFRYVHELSGQGLRPALEEDDAAGRWSWSTCARLGGYVILDDFTFRSRTIYPYRTPGMPNPSISVTYFAIPQGLAEELGITAE